MFFAASKILYNYVGNKVYEFTIDSNGDLYSLNIDHGPYHYLLDCKEDIYKLIESGKIRISNDGDVVSDIELSDVDTQYIKKHFDEYLYVLAHPGTKIDIKDPSPGVGEPECSIGYRLGTITAMNNFTDEAERLVEQPMTEEPQDAKPQISLDDLGIMLENVEVVCADSIKVVAKKSQNVTGDKIDIVI